MKIPRIDCGVEKHNEKQFNFAQPVAQTKTTLPSNLRRMSEVRSENYS